MSKCMVTCLISGCLFMTAFILFIISHPRNNLFMIGMKPELIKVEDIVTVILWPWKDEYTVFFFFLPFFRKEKCKRKGIFWVLYRQMCFITCRLLLNNVLVNYVYILFCLFLLSKTKPTFNCWSWSSSEDGFYLNHKIGNIINLYFNHCQQIPCKGQNQSQIDPPSKCTKSLM